VERRRPSFSGCGTLVAFTLTLLSACQAEPPPSPPCGDDCVDGIALRSLREMMKLVYNITLQANPVGAQDESIDCPLGGSAHVFGTATSNAAQGATEVDLTYEFEDCLYIELDDEPDETYRMTIDGTITQVGTMAVQPSATTALVMESDSVTFDGTVHDPPRDFHEENCVIDVAQNGNDLSGLFCGREAGVDLGGGPN
jgi:hypothetical protein